MMTTKDTTTIDDARRSDISGSFVKDFHGVRYQVSDVSRAAAFYNEHLGFKLKHQALPAFAIVSLDRLDLF